MTGRTVVVGGGSAGCAIAARVSESEAHTVTLLEAGPDYFNDQLPHDLRDGGRNSMRRHDWRYRHQPGASRVRFPFPRGRVLGGSSAVNTCIALRPQPYDLDEWADLGLPEWSWEQCVPYLKRIETDLDRDDSWHGHDGPLPLRRHPPSEWVVWQAAFVEACTAAGYQRCDDHNAPNSCGVGPHPMNKRDGRRISAADVYLTPEVRDRANLEIMANTHVRRVIFSHRRAVAVEVESGGQIERIYGDRIVLCAGAIATPGILLRSGIGPADILEKLGVESVYVAPGVSRQLLDHPGTAIFLRPRIGAATSRHDPLIQVGLRYGSKGCGRSNDMLLQPGSKLAPQQGDFPLVSIMTAIGKPKGTGQLIWESAKSHARPRIDSRLFHDPDDLAKGVEALSIAWDLAQRPVMSKLAVPLFPGRKTLSDPVRLAEWVRKGCDSGYHPCGTAPMGPDGDPFAVADGRGRVRGVTHLRIGDASLMPTIPSTNIHLTTLMIGERLGEWLRLEQ